MKAQIIFLFLLAAVLLSPRPAVAGHPSENGYVRLNVSTTKALVGTPVAISGFSVLYGSLKTVTLTITGPSASTSQTLPLKDSGSFSTTWIAAAAGTYKLTVKSSDGKAQETVTITAFGFQEMDSITGPTKEETKTAFDKLKNAVDQAKRGLSSNDVTTLEQRFKEVSDLKDKFITVLDDVDDAGKGLDALEKKYGKLPDQVLQGVSKLNDAFSELHQQMVQADAGGKGGGNSGGGGTATGSQSNHSSYDNTTCEYLVMVSEACAAFSLITTFYARIDVALTNVATGYGAPAAAGAVSKAAGGTDPGNAVLQLAAKLFATAGHDSKFLEKSLGQANLGESLVQLCSEILLKRYCAVLSGDLQENYQCTFRNSSNTVWWQYRYTTGATISLRYPKGSTSGGIIKMKGNIEGNATKFEIYQDASEIDDFKQAAKGRVHLFSVCVYAPPSVPFVSSRADKATGFGAVARGIATPAYFNIPIDADYNVDAGTIKVYVNPALVDFSPSVQYIYCYLTIAAMIPLTNRVNYPINRVRPTLGKVMGDNDTFKVQTGGDNKLSISGTGTTDIGKGTAIAHKIYFSFSMKSD